MVYNPSFEYTFINQWLECDICTAIITGEIPDKIVIRCDDHSYHGKGYIVRMLGQLKYDDPYQGISRIPSIIIISIGSMISESDDKRDILQALIDMLESELESDNDDNDNE